MTSVTINIYQKILAAAPVQKEFYCGCILNIFMMVFQYERGRTVMSVIRCCLKWSGFVVFVSAGRIILRTNVHKCAGAASGLRGPAGARAGLGCVDPRFRLMCFMYLTTVRSGVWLGLIASLGTPAFTSVLLLPAPHGQGGGRRTRGRQGSRAFLCLHTWWSPLFAFLRDWSSCLWLLFFILFY